MEKNGGIIPGGKSTKRNDTDGEIHREMIPAEKDTKRNAAGGEIHKEE